MADYDYNEIAAAEIVVGKPISSILLGKYRDNPLALFNKRELVIKQNDTDRTNDDTLAADPELQIPVNSNELWWVVLGIRARSDGATQLSTRITIANETQTGYFALSHESGTYTTSETRYLTNTITNFTIGTTWDMFWTGHVYVGTVGDPGYITFDWCQAVASGVNQTLVFKGSYIYGHRVDAV